MLRQLTLALACAFAVSPVLAADTKPAETPASDTPASFRWAAPWKPGMTLVYDTEERVDQPRDGKVVRQRHVVQTRISITRKDTKGAVQVWSDDPATLTMLEGDTSQQESRRAFTRALGDVAFDLAPDGTVTGVHDFDALLPRLRTAMSGVTTGQLEATLTAKQATPAQRKEATAAMQRGLDTMLSPAFAQGLLMRQPSAYNGFFGIDAEFGSEYEANVELPNPAGGAPLPAKITFAASLSESDPDDVFVTWIQEIDAEKMGALATAVGQQLSGNKLTEADTREIAKVDVRDEGFFLVHRITGVIEMMESTRTTKLPDGGEKIERYRMRQIDGAHDHEWREDDEADADAEDDEDDA